MGEGESWREKRRALRTATDEIMGRLASMLPQQYRGIYDDAIGRMGIDPGEKADPQDG